MIRRAYRCTNVGATNWHWELVRKGQVIRAGTSVGREAAWYAAHLQREELRR